MTGRARARVVASEPAGSQSSSCGRERHRLWISAALLPAILLGALLLRLLLSARLELESDEAIVGLMGRHILEGERPVFYYGQVYMGALEAYLVALAFSLAGISVFAMRLVTIALSLLFCYLIYLLGSRLYSQRVGLASALYVSIAPLLLTVWSVKVRGGYVETLVLGTALLVLLHDITIRERHEVWRLILFGITAGLGSWVNQLILPYLIVTALFVVLRLSRRAIRVALVSVPAFLVGSLPLWVWNVQNELATFSEIARANSTGLAGLLELPRNLARVAFLAMPPLLGFVEPTTDMRLFGEMRRAEFSAFALGFVATVGLAVLGFRWLVATPRPWRRHLTARPDSPLILLLLITPTMFALSKGAPNLWGEPRYLVPMYSAVPFFVACLLPLVERRRYVAVALVVAVLAFNLRSNLPVLLGLEVARYPEPAVQYLLERGNTRIYADYWLAYVLAFESDERIKAAVIDKRVEDGVRLVDNRYEPYIGAVADSANPAFVFAAGSAADQAFERLLIEQGTRYRRGEADMVAVYDDLQPAPPVAGQAR